MSRPVKLLMVRCINSTSNPGTRSALSGLGFGTPAQQHFANHRIWRARWSKRSGANPSSLGRPLVSAHVTHGSFDRDVQRFQRKQFPRPLLSSIPLRGSPLWHDHVTKSQLLSSTGRTGPRHTQKRNNQSQMHHKGKENRSTRIAPGCLSHGHGHRQHPSFHENTKAW